MLEKHSALRVEHVAEVPEPAGVELQGKLRRLTGCRCRRGEVIAPSLLLREGGQRIFDLQQRADATQCRLVVDNGSGRAVRGDPELVRRALENVVRNAIRYAPPGTDVELRAADTPWGIAVTVRDAGQGVPEDVLSTLTHPFFRAEDARDYTSHGGVGLGLSIAHRAVQLHHGTLVAENAHPGLRVTLTFPDAA